MYIHSVMFTLWMALSSLTGRNQHTGIAYCLHPSCTYTVCSFIWSSQDWCHNPEDQTATNTGDQKVSVHLITIQKVTSNVQSVLCQSAYIY
jgi:hypothetical protein